MSHGTDCDEIRFLSACLSKPAIWKHALIWKENPIKTNVVCIPKVVNGKEDWVLVTSCVDAFGHYAALVFETPLNFKMSNASWEQYNLYQTVFSMVAD